MANIFRFSLCLELELFYYLMFDNCLNLLKRFYVTFKKYIKTFYIAPFLKNLCHTALKIKLNLLPVL